MVWLHYRSRLVASLNEGVARPKVSNALTHVSDGIGGLGISLLRWQLYGVTRRGK